MVTALKDKVYNIAVIVCFLLVIYEVFIINIFKPADELSFSERRRLAQFPELSAGTILDSEFMKGFDEYAVDQIAFRNEWRRAKALFDLNVFRKYDNNHPFIVFQNAFCSNFT